MVACYNNRADLRDCFEALLSSDDPGVDVHLLMVDDASTDGSVAWVRQNFSDVEVLALPENRGYAGANNAGYEHIKETRPDADYLVLLNADTAVESGWLRTLADFMAAHPDAGAVQPKIVLFDQPNIINTVGNRSHYLGFGMMTGYGEEDRGQYDTPRTIDFPSGCAVMLRMDLLDRFGLFDESFYMYLEDADLGWKLTQAGYPCWFCPDAAVRHKYIPNAPLKAYEHLERNRWALLLTYYRWSTLLLLLPVLVLMEIGQWVFVLSHWMPNAKCRQYYRMMTKPFRAAVAARRRESSDQRRLSDTLRIHDLAGRIVLPTGNSWALTRLMNPVLESYQTLLTQSMALIGGGEASRSRGGRAIRAAVSGIVYQFVYAAGQFVLLGVMIRAIGEAAMGFWVTVAALTLGLGMLTVGVPHALMTQVGAARWVDPQRAGSLIAGAAAFVGWVALGAAVLSASSAFWMPWETVLGAAAAAGAVNVAVVAAVTMATAALGLYGGVWLVALQASQRGDVAYAFLIITQIAAITLAVGGLWLGVPMSWIAAILMSPPLISGLLSRWLGRRWGILPSFARGDAGGRAVSPLLGRGWRYAGFIWADLLLFQSGPLLVAMTDGASAVAIYAAAFRLSMLMIVVSQSIERAVWPAYGDAVSSGEAHWLARGLGFSVLLLGAAWLVVSVGVMIAGPWIVSVWLGPDAVVSRTTLASAMLFALAAAIYGQLSALARGLNKLSLGWAVAAVLTLVIVIGGGLLGYWIAASGVFIAQAAGGLCGVFLLHHLLWRKRISDASEKRLHGE